MVIRRKGVTVILDSDFFDNIFEPARRDLERQLGTRVSQKSFTNILSKKKINLKINVTPFKNVKKIKRR